MNCDWLKVEKQDCCVVPLCSANAVNTELTQYVNTFGSRNMESDGSKTNNALQTGKLS